MQKRTIFMMADGDMPFNGFCALSSLLKDKKCYRLVIICEKVKSIEDKLIKYGLTADDVEILVYDSSSLTRYVSKKMRKDKCVREESPHERKWVSKFKSIYERKDKDIHYSMPYLFWQTGKELKRLKREERIAENIFFKYSPGLLLLVTDRNIGLIQSMIYIAKRNNVPRVVTPVASVALIENLMNMRYGKKECEVDEQGFDSKRLMEKINANWIWKYKGKKYIFYQPWVALAGWILKRISLNPWLVGGGDATLVAVSRGQDYIALRRLCKDEITREKYILTQGIEDSIVNDSYSNRKFKREIISEKYGIKGSKIIIFALPQMYEHQMASWDVCKKNITMIIEKLVAQDADLLVSLHPKMEKDMYHYIEEMERVHILDEALSCVLGIADIFVVLDECSTKKWAEYLGIDIITFKVNEFCHIMGENVIEEIVNAPKTIGVLKKNEDCVSKNFCEIIEEMLH